MVTSHGRPLNSDERQNIKKAASIIMGEFTWDSTHDGDGFWNQVYSKLIDIANERPTCESCGQELPG